MNKLPIIIGGLVFLLVLSKPSRNTGGVIPTPPSRIPPGSKVSDKLTPITIPEATKALKDSYYAAVGYNISANTLGMGLAQTSLETGNYQKIHWWNFGNITASSSFSGAWTDYLGDTTHHYRVYQDAFEGAYDYWRLLIAQYPKVLAEFEAGNPIGAARELKAKGYYEAPESLYAGTLKALFAKYYTEPSTLALLAPEPPPKSILGITANKTGNRIDVLSNGQAFLNKLWSICIKNGWNADAIISVMANESGLNPQAKNKASTAAGLLQIIDSTAAKIGTSSAEIISMNALDQLDIVEKYYQYFFSRLSIPKSRVGYYTLGWGAGVVSNLGVVLASKNDPKTAKLYELNASLDTNHDGKITVGDLDSILATVYASAKGNRVEVSPHLEA